MIKKIMGVQCFILMIAPCIISLLFAYILSIRGPIYSALFFDPDYAYLTNALDFLHLRTGMLFGHPGTPPQVFGAIVIALQWSSKCLYTSCPPLAEDVLANPESYLNTIIIASGFILICLIFLLGKSIYSFSSSLPAAFISQISFVAIPDMMLAMIRYSAEPFLMIMAIIASLSILSRVRELDSDLIQHKYQSLLYGFIIGFGISVKITFIPLLILGYFLAHPKNLVTFYLSALAGLLVGILPIISHFIDIFAWFSQIAIKNGVYGSGDAGLPKFDNWIVNIKTIASLRPTFVILSVFYILIGLIFIFKSQATTLSKLRNNSFHLLTVTFCTTLLAQYIIVLKHYNGTHYLIPSMTLLLLMNGLFYSKIVSHKNKKLFSLLIIVLIIYSLKQLNDWRNYTVRYLHSSSQVEDKVSKELSGCQRSYYFRSTSIAHAIGFGNSWAYNHYAAQALKLYSKTIIYDRWKLGFYNLSGTSVTDLVKMKLRNHSCLVLIGTSNDTEMFELINKTFEFDVIIQTEFDVAYKIKAFL